MRGSGVAFNTKEVGERLAELTQNEAAYVSSGAAAGLVLAAAACITGTDPAAISQLPDLSGTARSGSSLDSLPRFG